MGVLANSNGKLWSGTTTTRNSGFTGITGGSTYTGVDFPDGKYYDVYKAYSGFTINALTACDEGICYGHGLSEVYNWYGDQAGWVNNIGSWFSRGLSYQDGVLAGVFSFAHNGGAASGSIGFRSVVSFVGA